MHTKINVQEESFLLSGQAGNLETVIHLPDNSKKIVVVICHPHSLHGGTMDNKVVTTIMRASVKLRMPVVRFNFRSVGNSEGEFDNGIGEQQDLLSVLKFAQKKFPDSKVILAGFSFGSYVAYQVAKQVTLLSLIIVGGAVHNWNYELPVDYDFPILVVHGDQDEITSIEHIREWVNQINPSPEFRVIEDGSHFFHGKLLLLEQQVRDFLTRDIIE